MICTEIKSLFSTRLLFFQISYLFAFLFSESIFLFHDFEIINSMTFQFQALRDQYEPCKLHNSFHMIWDNPDTDNGRTITN